MGILGSGIPFLHDKRDLERRKKNNGTVVKLLFACLAQCRPY